MRPAPIPSSPSATTPSRAARIPSSKRSSVSKRSGAGGPGRPPRAKRSAVPSMSTAWNVRGWPWSSSVPLSRRRTSASASDAWSIVIRGVRPGGPGRETSGFLPVSGGRSPSTPSLRSSSLSPRNCLTVTTPATSSLASRVRARSRRGRSISTEERSMSSVAGSKRTIRARSSPRPTISRPSSLTSERSLTVTRAAKPPSRSGAKRPVNVAWKRPSWTVARAIAPEARARSGSRSIPSATTERLTVGRSTGRASEPLTANERTTPGALPVASSTRERTAPGPTSSGPAWTWRPRTAIGGPVALVTSASPSRMRISWMRVVTARRRGRLAATPGSADAGRERMNVRATTRPAPVSSTARRGWLIATRGTSRSAGSAVSRSSTATSSTLAPTPSESARTRFETRARVVRFAGSARFRSRLASSASRLWRRRAFQPSGSR